MVCMSGLHGEKEDEEELGKHGEDAEDGIQVTSDTKQRLRTGSAVHLYVGARGGFQVREDK